MSNLPFVVQPRLKPIKEIIGNEDSGQLEIERRGYLSAGEKSFMQAQFNSEGVTRATLALVRDISREFKLTQEKAYEELQKVLGVTKAGQLAVKISEKFGEQINELTEMMVEIQVRRRLITAYCMVIYRISSNVSFDDFMELHPDLIDALADLYNDEEKKSTDRIKAAVPDAGTGEEASVEDLEKKS